MPLHSRPSASPRKSARAITQILGDLSIGRKLTLITAGVSFATLLLTSSAFIGYEFIRFRSDATAELETLADIIGTNSAGALLFDDSPTAVEVLAALAAVDHIEAAAVYGGDGALFAAYPSVDSPSTYLPATVMSGDALEDSGLWVARAVVLEGDTLGVVYVRSTMGRLGARVRRYSAIAAVVMLASFLLAVLLATRAQRVISGPITDLVAVADAVSEGSDYSIRAVPRNSDEIGRLIHAFNEMLSQIEERDIALSQAACEARAGAQAKSDFLATMSHEIRTPLNGVLGMTELVLRTALSDEQRDYVGTIESSGASLLRIIDDILDFSKVEAGKLSIESVDVELRAVVDECVELLAPSAVEKGIAFGYKVSPKVPQVVAGDGTRIRQVLLNLLGNAIKFTAEGEVSLIVDIAEEDADDLVLRFEVHDTGIGIAPETQEALFQPFSQADASTTRSFGGTGLGLAISRRLAKLMGGEAGLESEPGNGSTFWFTIRVPARSDAPVMPQVSVSSEGRSVPIGADHATGAPQSQVRFADARVLLVEDNEVNQLIAKAILKRRGLHVDVAENGAVGVEAVRTKPYDLVLMDCQMPVLDGYEATRQIRHLEGAVRSVPIVAMTANAMDGDRERCLAAGMDDYLSKPLDHARLFEVVEQWIGRGDATLRPESAARSR